MILSRNYKGIIWTDELRMSVLERRAKGVSLKKIGKEYGVSHERIRQIERHQESALMARYQVGIGKEWLHG